MKSQKIRFILQTSDSPILTFRKWVESFPASGEECRVAGGEVYTYYLKHLLRFDETKKKDLYKLNYILITEFY